jgi:predicted metal-dependent TIM-barrel fold hydrolase
MLDKISLKGIIDLHVHSHPDIRERAYTDFELLEAGVKAGAKAIVIKTHHGTTMDRAYLANEYNKKVYNGDNDFIMYGGITLNYAVGGLNPIAVETALKLGAKIVWLPTIHAANQMEKFEKTGGINCVIDGKPVPVLTEIFSLIKEYDAVLATGHLSPEDIFIVVDYAKQMGLEKILINHPEFWVVGMSNEDQERLVKEYGVYLERCYAQPMGGGVYKSNLEDNYELIKKIGCENIIVNTDGGQVENPHWELAFAEYMQYLFDRGITNEELEVMTIKNPAKLLNIGK